MDIAYPIDPGEAGEGFHGLYEWLRGYIQRLGCPDADCRFHFRLKWTHTLRVVGEITALGRHLQLTAADQRIARAIALLHDVGRFEQYLRHRTYNDEASVDHGALGARIVREARILCEFDAQVSEMICTAIHCHNKRTLPRQLTEETLFFARLIRDADKLDIYRVILKHGANADRLGDPAPKPLEAEVSDRIYEVLMQGRTIDFTDVQNETDMVMARIGWVFDLNFPPTLVKLAKRNYIGRLAAALPATPRVDQIIAKVQQYLGAP